MIVWFAQRSQSLTKNLIVGGYTKLMEQLLFNMFLAQAASREGLPWLWWLAPIGAISALVAAFLFYRGMMTKSEGEGIMVEIAQAVREGAMAYLFRQYRVVAMVFAALFVIFAILAFVFDVQNTIVPFAFLTSGLFSGLCGYIGMKTATNASARTANAARESLNSSLQVAFRAGAVMGLVVVGFALLDISVWFLVLYNLFPAASFGGVDSQLAQITVVMVSFSMGASTQALFARVGGGIFTKAADVGADLVGKVEAGIPEDDPRNPATIADNVGDNVGDVAGMGADLYESYAGSILATAALGVAAVSAAALTDPAFLEGGTLAAMQLRYLAVPMSLAGLGIFLSIMGVFLVRAKEDANMEQLLHSLERGVRAAAGGIAILSLPILFFLGVPNAVNIWVAIVTGLLVGLIIGQATGYYTSHAYAPTRGIAAQAATGPATVIIEGLAVGMRSTGVMVLTVAVGIVISFYAAGGVDNILMGLFGVGVAAVGMLSTLGITLATDAYGPIADNAGGNAEMAGLPPVVRQRTDQLDALGNTTAATGKGFAIGSAALTVMALIAAYLETVRFFLARQTESVLINDNLVLVTEMSVRDFMVYYDVNPVNPAVLVGLFIGGMTAFFFCAMTMSAVGRAAGIMVEEVRRQFREYPGIMAGTQRPDYGRCVEISTVAAQKEMIAPSLLAIVVPVVIGALFGVAGVLGLLVGALAAGFSMAVMMSNAGGAWDNAKKYIEQGAHGGKGSPSHKASIVGDTVGDPFKDTSGPSLNILIKLMSIVSVVFAGLIVQFGPGGLIGMMLGMQ
jgi:K(+)-stimulated pyrophosphate-energized sodium pump